VVAGGLSTGMGALKQLLPYGPHTVIEQIVSVLLQCALHEVVLVETDSVLRDIDTPEEYQQELQQLIIKKSSSYL
jgi:CTP:molybdopterin cytidylyltransferase MocA